MHSSSLTLKDTLIMTHIPWSQRHPYLTVGLIELGIIVTFIVSGAAVQILGLPNVILGIGANLVLAMIAIVVLAARRQWRAIGFRTPSQITNLRWFWLPCVPIIMPLALYGIAPAWQQFGPLIVLAVLTGFVEEVYFRGFMLRALAARGAWRAALVSAGLFGLTHALNALSGSDPTYVLLQIGYACAIGFCYAALVLRTGLLWPLIVTHILTDVAAFLSSGRAGAAEVDTATYVLAVVYIVAFTAYGIYVLRRGTAAMQNTHNEHAFSNVHH